MQITNTLLPSVQMAQDKTPSHNIYMWTVFIYLHNKVHFLQIQWFYSAFTSTKWNHHGAPAAVQTDMEPIAPECGSCISEQNMLLYLCVSLCVFGSYRDRLSPCGFVVNLSWVERFCLCGRGRPWWLVQLHAHKPHQHGEESRTENDTVKRSRVEKRRPSQ